MHTHIQHIYVDISKSSQFSDYFSPILPPNLGSQIIAKMEGEKKSCTSQGGPPDPAITGVK